MATRIKSAVREATRPCQLAAGALKDLRRSRSELIAENALLRQQLIVVSRKVRRSEFKPHERGLLVLLSRCVRGWRDALLLVNPDTVLRLSLPKTSTTAKSLRSVRDRATVPNRAEPLPFLARGRTRLLQDPPPTGHRDPGPASPTGRPQTLGQTPSADERGPGTLGAAITPMDELERCVDPRQAGHSA